QGGMTSVTFIPRREVCVCVRVCVFPSKHVSIFPATAHKCKTSQGIPCILWSFCVPSVRPSHGGTETQQSGICPGGLPLSPTSHTNVPQQASTGLVGMAA